MEKTIGKKGSTRAYRHSNHPAYRGRAGVGRQPGGVRVLGIPLFALSVALAFIIQWFAFFPAFIFQTEKF